MIPFHTMHSRVIAGLGLLALASLPAVAAPKTEAQLRTDWGATMAKTPTPHEGCFTAAYPSAVWKPVACGVAPTKPYVPRSGAGRGGFTVGDGNDYSAVVSGIITSGVGSFPKVKGLKTETDQGQANSYSIQLNSQFFASPTCSGAKSPKSCLGWEQFVYANPGEAFMQYWLINYGNKCPSGGWMAYSTDCYRNSSSVRVPAQVIKQLKNLTLSGAAVANGIDTVTLTTATNAYSATGQDSVVDLAGYWNAAEFNIIGDGGGSEANFNKGTKLTVNIALTDGQTTAPTCQPNDGTTGETNNLNLGNCTTAGGSTPSVTFLESN